jgi:hypothetical protein
MDAMREKSMVDARDKTFDPQTMAGDLDAVQRIYTDFFAGLNTDDWAKPSQRGPGEWSLHETVAHLCALNGAGLESIKHLLQGRSYALQGLQDRYDFGAYNRTGIDEHLGLPVEALCEEFLDILEGAAFVAQNLKPDQMVLAARMPIYNRPVRIIEALGIMMIHAGLFHSAQVAEPAGRPPLWKKLPSEIRQRVIGRVMRALSLLYRHDLSGDLRAVFMFRVGGPGGGCWHIEVSPDSTLSDEGVVDQPDLTVHLHNTDHFCRMFTGRINLPLALLTGQLKLRGNLRLFLRFGSLFSVDARR